MTRQVAALYVDEAGPYSKLPGVDIWPVSRDARKYPGPVPVVAHPPCGPWGRLSHLCTRQDPQLALAAVKQIAQFGGVLEHPAHSKLWAHLDLPRPNELPFRGFWTLRVDQVRWGHVARKPTWLLFSKISPSVVGPLPPPRSPTHWIGGSKTDPHRPPGMGFASGVQARRTPEPFARWLVSLARGASTP